MSLVSQNTWCAKFIRTFTAVLPYAKARRGACANCGACCSLPVRCPFLKNKPDGKSFCSIHALRPLNCRKYPRNAKEHITCDTCGYKFE